MTVTLTSHVSITLTTSEFQQKMIEYLESVYVGEFLTGSMHEVKQNISLQKMEDPHYEDPTQTMPIPPPDECKDDDCSNYQALETWWDRFRATVDDLIFKSNVHPCRGQKSDEYFAIQF